MKRLLWVAVVAAGTLIGTPAFAERGSASGNFGVGSEPVPHYPWEEVRGARPTFSVQAERKTGQWFDVIGYPASARSQREGRSSELRPVSVRSVEDRSEVRQPLDAIGR